VSGILLVARAVMTLLGPMTGNDWNSKDVIGCFQISRKLKVNVHCGIITCRSSKQF
jgi:hypothetical protein